MTHYEKEIADLQLRIGILLSQGEQHYQEVEALRRRIAELQRLRDAAAASRPASPGSGSAWEKYIGQNLIPIVGVIITVIGVGMGAKYAIDHQLITPLMRIVLGYVAGGLLLAFAFWFEKKYTYFSAVLLSGSMAIFYFITFFAYSFYNLMPLVAAFGLMTAITAFTVWSAIRYNLQLIAHIGLVGAYAVPLLLSNNSGRIGIFFSYIALINAGILVVSFFRNWKSLYYVSFGLTWFVFMVWSVNHLTLKTARGTDYLLQDQHFQISMIFLVVFFILFYATNLAYKLIKKEKADAGDILMILLNSFIFYMMGMVIVTFQDNAADLRGTFTLVNAGIHLAVAALLYLRKSEDRSLLVLSSALALTFLTISIPMKFDGNWVTCFWICEAGFLFWFGRTQAVKLVEIFSHPLVLVAFISLCIDYFSGNAARVPFWNGDLAAAAFFAGVLYFMHWFARNERHPGVYHRNEGMQYLTGNLVYVLFLLIAFFAVEYEISAFWRQKYDLSAEYALNVDYFAEHGDIVLKAMGRVSSVVYALLFVSALTFSRTQRKNTEEFNIIFILVYVLFIFMFLLPGLYALNFMHLKYLFRPEDTIYYRGPWLIGVRYIAFAVMALAMFRFMRFVRHQMPWRSMQVLSEYILHMTIVWCASAELVNWVHSMNSAQAYKLTLSIFAGIYALFMIVLGIWKRKSYLRIGAISLFGITLLKLFLYDIRHLETIFKAIVLISLGVLLLIISFLYNRYKSRMFD